MAIQRISYLPRNVPVKLTKYGLTSRNLRLTPELRWLPTTEQHFEKTISLKFTERNQLQMIKMVKTAAMREMSCYTHTIVMPLLSCL